MNSVDEVAVTRRYPIGAEVLPDGVSFRVWAPKNRQVFVELSTQSSWETPTLCVELERDADGYFAATVQEAHAGEFYKFRVDEGIYPDPASRFQPDGPHGASQIVDGTVFRWSDDRWRGVTAHGQVIYELHIGTFTPEGTWAAAIRQLEELAALGVTMIEVMPVADFVGKFGWGYDGVDLFAPTRLYGTPDEFRGFVDRAHALGLGVILDVVYNHLGPDGNYLRPFSDAYFSDRYLCDWGEAINFDDECSGPVREFFLTNAAYWIQEFHLDGLRLDATQQLFDASPLHIVAEIGIRARAAAAARSIYIVTENEPQEARMLLPVQSGGYGLDALWNDDFHHSSMVALTGRNEAYYVDYLGGAQEFVSAAKWGCLFQGQFYRWQKKRRGRPMFGLPPTAFVNFLQNHDQIANSALGARVHQLTSPAKFRAMTALLLLMPGTPMLFQGQEFAATTCFHYFADHEPALAALVAEGRRSFLSQFPSIEQPETMDLLRDPADEQTFLKSKLDFAERERHAQVYSLHRDLLKIRRDDPFLREPQPGTFDGAVLSEEAFVLRYFGAGQQHRLLVVNLGRDLHLPSAPEPLLAPPPGCEWETLFTSEDPSYGGVGNPPLETPDEWRVPGSAAVYLGPRPTLSES